MAIIEINLEKPALIEERRYPGASGSASESSSASSSGGNKGKLLGVLALAVGVAVLAWKLKSGGSDDYDSEEYEHGPEPEIGGERSGVRGKVAGMVGFAVALVSVVAAVRKARN